MIRPESDTTTKTPLPNATERHCCEATGDGTVRSVQPASLYPVCIPPNDPGTVQPVAYDDTRATTPTRVCENAPAPSVGGTPANRNALAPAAPSNAPLPIDATLAGIVTVPVSPVAPVKAPAAIAVTTHPPGQFAPVGVNVPGIDRFARARFVGPVIVSVSGTVPLTTHVTPVPGSVPLVAYGVATLEPGDGSDRSPATLTAIVVNQYVVPSTRPVIVHVPLAPLIPHECTPSLAMMVSEAAPATGDATVTVAVPGLTTAVGATVGPAKV